MTSLPRPRLLGGIALLLAALAPATHAQPRPGDPDLSFGAGDGTFATEEISPGAVVLGPAMTVAPDGSIALAGTTWPPPDRDGVVYRVDADGQSGRTIGQLTDFEVTDLAYQADGKLLVAGRTAGQFAVARLGVDGQLDNSYAGDGIYEGDAGIAYEMALEPNGSAIVVGQAGSDVARVERISAGGLPLDSYSAFLGDVSALLHVALRADGRILAAGYAGSSSSALLGLTSGLAPDPGFIPEAAGVGSIGDVAIQGDGRILLSTKMPPDASGTERVQVLLRLRPDGSRDPKFRPFKVEVIRGVFAGDLAVDAAGRVVFGGSFLGRAMGDGALDSGFAASGFTPSPVEGVEIALQDDGGILVSWHVPNSAGSIPGSLGVSRFLGGSLRCGGRKVTRAGTQKRDTIQGTNRRDVIAALGGNDRVLGLRGNDVVCGGRGRDRLLGGPGRDRLLGGAGRDLLRGGKGRDVENQ